MTGWRNIGRRSAYAAAVVAVLVAGLAVAVLSPVSVRRRAATPAASTTAAAVATTMPAPSTTAAAETAGPANARSSSSAAAVAPLGSASPVAVSGGVTGGVTGVGPTPPPALVPTDTVVRTGSLTLQVGKGGFGRAFSSAASIARDEGGFVVTAFMGPGSGPLPGDVGSVGAGSTAPQPGPLSGDVGGVGPTASPTSAAELAPSTGAPDASPSTGVSPPTAGTLVMRVPGAKFDDARRRLEALGDLQGEQLSGQDAGGQLSDLAARITDLRAEQDGLRAMVSRATSTGDLLPIEAQLGAVHQQLDGLLAQQAELGDHVALASITLSMSEPIPAPPAPRSVLSARAHQAGRALEAVAGGTLVVLAYGGPLAALAALVAVAVAASRRRRAAMG